MGDINVGDDDRNIYVEIDITDDGRPGYDDGQWEPPRAKGFESLEEYDRLIDAEEAHA